MEAVSVPMAVIKVVATKLAGVKAWSVLSFITGMAVTLAFNLGRSNSPQHVYELRMYQVNEGKMNALIARFGDHTDQLLSAPIERLWSAVACHRFVTSPFLSSCLNDKFRF